MDCNDIQDILDAHILGVLEQEQSKSIEEHIKECQSCKNYFVEANKSLKKFNMLPVVKPSTSYADRIIKTQKKKKIVVWTVIISLCFVLYLLWTLFSLFTYQNKYSEYHITRLEKAVWGYYIQNEKKFPSSLKELNESATKNTFKRDAEGFILDIWGNRYQYIFPGKYNDLSFDIYSFGQNRQDEKGEGDDIKNWK